MTKLKKRNPVLRLTIDDLENLILYCNRFGQPNKKTVDKLRNHLKKRSPNTLVEIDDYIEEESKRYDMR